MSFDDHIRGALDKAVASIRGHLEADLRDFAQHLERSAAEERARAIAQAVEAATADVRRQAEDQLAQLRDTAQKQQDELRQSAEAQTAELRCQLEEARAQLETATRDLETVRHDLDAARRDLESRQHELEAARREAEAARRDLEAAHRDIEARQRDLDAMTRDLDARRREIETLTERVQEMKDEVEQARRIAAFEVEEIAKRQLLDAADAAEQRLADALDRARAESQQAMRSQAVGLASALRAIDDARTLGGVLNALADGAAREVDRAAVLVVRGARLAGWRLSGFDEQAASSLDLSLDEAGTLATVVRTASSIAPVSGVEQMPLAPFAGEAGARRAAAHPIIVGGSVVAVLYGDAPGGSSSGDESRWAAVLEVLARHAGRALEAMTVRQAIGLAPSPPAATSNRPPLGGVS